MTRTPTIVRRGLVAVTLAAVASLGLAACGDEDNEDRDAFVEASNELVETFEALDDKYVALGTGDLEVPDFAEQAAVDLEAMEDQTDELEVRAEELTGEAREIADAATVAATEVIAATRSIVEAIALGDEEELAEGIEAAEAAIDAFNEQITAWNEL